MRHRVTRHHLSRAADQRKALLRALATELLKHDEIITTEAKAKAVRGEAEKLITLGKKGYLADPKSLKEKAKSGDADAAKQLAKSLHCRRQVAAYIYDGDVVKKVFTETAQRFQDRKGGYTRIIKAGIRRGDATPMAIIQLV
jgi:large subunit ribosomal protein L17